MTGRLKALLAANIAEESRGSDVEIEQLREVSWTSVQSTMDSVVSCHDGGVLTHACSCLPPLQGLGLKTPSVDFWKPLGAATMSMAAVSPS